MEAMELLLKSITSSTGHKRWSFWYFRIQILSFLLELWMNSTLIFQYAHVYLKDSMTVEEFLANACSRKNLNPMEHFVRVKKRREMEDHNYFVPPRGDLIETYVSVCIFFFFNHNIVCANHHDVVHEQYLRTKTILNFIWPKYMNPRTLAVSSKRS